MMAYRGINTYDAKKVVRPTMVPDREEAAANGGTIVHMVETDFNGPPPPPPADPLAWATQPTVTGTTQPGNTLTGTLGTVTGGTNPQPKGRWRWRVSADAGNSWEIRTNWSTDEVQTYELQPEDVGQVQMQCQVTDPEVETLSKSVVKTITAPALNVQAPTLTGDPCVGYTLSCSQPVVTGGSGGALQYDYFWVDETNVIVWEAAKMAPTTIVTEYDLGKKMKCLVTVTDKGYQGGESVTVESNQTIEVFRPTLGDYQTYVDNVLIEQTSVGVTPSQLCMCVVQEDDPVLFPPKDVSYNWELRTGTGTLRGDNGLPYMSYLAPDAAPAGAMVTCGITSNHAQDVQSVQFEFLIADGP